MLIKVRRQKRLALDIDDTVIDTKAFWFKSLSAMHNPEGLSVDEFKRKYKHTSDVPYWQEERYKKFIRECIVNDTLHETLPVILEAKKSLVQIAKYVEIFLYITVRSNLVLPGTRKCIREGGLPVRTIISYPSGDWEEKPALWKSKILKTLNKCVDGIVDDHPGLPQHAYEQGFDGYIFSYTNGEEVRTHNKAIPCADWSMTERKVIELLG